MTPNGNFKHRSPSVHIKNQSFDCFKNVKNAVSFLVSDMAGGLHYALVQACKLYFMPCHKNKVITMRLLIPIAIVF